MFPIDVEYIIIIFINKSKYIYKYIYNINVNRTKVNTNNTSANNTISICEVCNGIYSENNSSIMILSLSFIVSFL